MAGYIKLYRGWRENEIFGREYSRGDAWVWLIENACWKPTRHRIKGKTIELQRGELSFAQRFLAEKWGWSKSRVDRFMSDLRAEGMIATRSKIGATAGHNAGRGQAIISICNYEKYQGGDEDLRGNDDAEIGATAGQQRGKEEEVKEGKKEKIIARDASRPADVSEQVWEDFLKLRKAKRAPLTETALAVIQSEAAKAGWSVEEALEECVARGWQGFKAGWVGAQNDNRVVVPV